ncbi:MAG: hypothetical protein IT204_17690 [Fimbriimonadaceae bacterium]|nr:hypothetical protein [Fimbriimonadaceae bacterium]
MLTRPASATGGVEVVVEGGAVTEFNQAGCPPGTDISVSNLFFNVPARLKFLRTSSTEMEHILAHLTAFCLLHHDVAFRVEHNGRQVLSSPATHDLVGAVATVYGAELAREMLPLDLDGGNLTVRGLIGRPTIARVNRTHQVCFVNGRPIKHRSLTHALYDGYHTLLMSGRHPVAVIVIDMEPSAVDVNVHPAKAEVRFSRDWEVHNLVRRAVREALENAGLLSEDREVPGRSTPYQPRVGGLVAAAAGDPAAGPQQPSLFDTVAEESPAAERGGLPARLVPLGQVAHSYIVCDSDEGLVVIDQHALHERVLYEQFAAAEAGRGVARQLLAVPLPLALSPREAQAVAGNLPALAELGFELEPFGGDTFLVRAVPTVLAHRDHDRVLRDVIDDLVASAGPRSYTQHRDYVLRTMACKAAIKAGDHLAPEEIHELLRLMRECQVPFHCNHGRPTMFAISHEALEKRFGRI